MRHTLSLLPDYLKPYGLAIRVWCLGLPNDPSICVGEIFLEFRHSEVAKESFTLIAIVVFFLNNLLRLPFSRFLYREIDKPARFGAVSPLLPPRVRLVVTMPIFGSTVVGLFKAHFVIPNPRKRDSLLLMKQPVLVMFGGVSAEHEVSVVTGLQALEQVDRARYEPIAVYVDKHGEIYCLPGLQDRYGFGSAKRVLASFGRDTEGGYLRLAGALGKTVRPYAALLVFHGGTGESGPVQGLLETVGIPHTGSTVEGSAIAMNKKLTKEAVAGACVPTLEDARFFAADIRKDTEMCAKSAAEKVGLPAIVKPVHLGSSIGIAVAKTSVALQKALMEAAHTDSEILVEPFLEAITEYNCAVRETSTGLEASEVEKPVAHDDILSFADKYERGGKKQGAGMASLARELPAKIPPEKMREIQEFAKQAFAAARLSGMARLDFMQDTSGTLYLTEINPIPGSLAYYLWEASGIPFTTQISDSIEMAVTRAKEREVLTLDYKSDIIERFTRRQ